MDVREWKKAIKEETLEITDEFEKELYCSNKYKEIKRWSGKVAPFDCPPIDVPPFLSQRLFAHLTEYVEYVWAINVSHTKDETIQSMISGLKSDLTELQEKNLVIEHYSIFVSMMKKINTILFCCISPDDIPEIGSLA